MLQAKSNLHDIKASDCMTKNPKTIQEEAFVYEAFSIMKKNNITQLLVTKNKKYMGIIHLHDILKHNILGFLQFPSHGPGKPARLFQSTPLPRLLSE